jgi:transcriptional regulator with XRE-family HTH domain
MENVESTRYARISLLAVDGKALTDARIKMRLSIEGVADKLGCNASSVSRWEQGKLQPSPFRLRALEKLYKTQNFVRLNEKASLTDEEVLELRKLRKNLLQGCIRLNGEAMLRSKEIEVVRRLREG